MISASALNQFSSRSDGGLCETLSLIEFATAKLESALELRLLDAQSDLNVGGGLKAAGNGEGQRGAGEERT